MSTATASVAAPNYLSSAFYSQYNLILLGGSALFSLASASVWPLAAGVGAELLWLGLGSRASAFRRSIDGRVEAARRSRVDDEVLSGMKGLGPEHNSRLLAVGQTISLISMHGGGTESEELRAALAELEQLRPTFLQFCQLHERLSQRLHEMVVNPPQQEVQRLSAAYAAEKDLGVRLTLHQSIKLAQKKIEQQSRMIELRRNVELKLSMVEQVLGMLRNQQQLGAPVQELVHEMRGLVAQVGTPASFDAEPSEGGAAAAISVPPRSASF
jgi:hypothetical protein